MTPILLHSVSHLAVLAVLGQGGSVRNLPHGDIVTIRSLT
jgi:hypothetical protein